MSTTEVKSAAVHDKLVDVTTCCICRETYTDPKILPCVHTFCLTCLQRTGTQKNRRPGDPMPCPLCRQEFAVPQEGFAALPKNFFMEVLVEIAATQQGASSVCNKHEHENLCLYCSDCSEVLCLVCLRESHQNHRLSDLSSTANSLCSQLQNNVGTAKRYMSDALKKKERLAQRKKAILEKKESFEGEVLQIRSDLKALIDQHADSILQNLDLLGKKGIKDIEIEEEELEKHLASLKNFEKCCAELTSNDRHDSLICKMAIELREQIVDLELFNTYTVECPLHSFEIYLTKTEPAPLEEFNKKNSDNLIGKVEAIDCSINRELVLTNGTNNAAESKCDGISGMTVSNDKVFIVNYNKPVVRIYDSNTLRYISSLDVTDYVSDVDLGPCASVNGIVYIVNRFSSEILQIDQNLVLSKWSTKHDWRSLSVTDASTVVATCYESSALREYTLQGTLLHEIELCSGIRHPSHAIKLNNGHFFVSHGDSDNNLKGVCLVSHDGGIMKSFDVLRGSRIKHLFDVRTCLAVDDDGNVLVLDGYNGCVLLLSPELEFKGELLTKANGLRWPVAMHLDKKTSRLYIADEKFENFKWSDSKILMFDVKHEHFKLNESCCAP